MPRGSGRDAKRAAAQESPRGLPPRHEQVVDGFIIRSTTGAAGKTYRCPGCDQELRAPAAHLVTWPDGAPDDRRHWHSACWAARDRRTVKVHRSKNAPRYG